MTKKVFNRFDPFMPIKVDNRSMNSNLVQSEVNELFDDFNNSMLNESIKFRAPRIKKDFTVLLTKTAIGKEGELGKKLLEDFVYSLSDSLELPQYLIFMNEAVFLLDTPKIENEIVKLKKFGVKTLVSIESLDYFKHNINNQLVIKATSGDITEKILFSKKLINM